MPLSFSIICRTRHQPGPACRTAARRAWRRIMVILLPGIFCAGCVHQDLSSSAGKDFPEKAGITIVDNTIFQNNRAGIQVRGDRSVQISACDIHLNGRAGINLENSARVQVENSNLYGNGTSGITADNPVQVSVRNSQLHHNGRAGMRIRKFDPEPTRPSVALLHGNRIFDNQRGGAHVIADGPAPILITLEKNQIFGNREAGVRIEDNVHLRADGNIFAGNGTSGVASYITADQSPVLDVFQNRIYFNRAAGIFVHSGVTGEIGISNNLIYNNYLSGISCGLWDGPEQETIDLKIFHNTIVANGSNEEGAGIRNHSRGKTVIEDNIIAYNFSSGINTLGCSSISHNLLYANGSTVAAADGSNPRPFLMEKEQYAGCGGRQWGDVLSDPLFVDPEQYNFALQSGSPARDAATELESGYFVDLPNPDLGADPTLVAPAVPGND